MKKIQALHQFILGLNLVAADDVDSYVDKLTLTPSGRPDSVNMTDRVLADTRYTATFYLSGYPFNRHPIERLIAQLSAWLLDYDDERKESAELSITVDVLDEHGNVADVANLEFDVVFDERVVITPDDGGDIAFNGMNYSLL